MLSLHCDCELITCPAINSKIRFKGSHRPAQRLCKEPFRAHSLLAKAMITWSHMPLPRPHFGKVKAQIERMRVQSDKIQDGVCEGLLRDVSIRSSSSRRCVGLCEFKVLLWINRESREDGSESLVGVQWGIEMGTQMGTRSFAKPEFVTWLKFGLWYRQVSVSVKILSFYFTLCRCGDTQHHWQAG